ncbi:MAG TPA: quinol:electron acceptor oxidoreductase subunit ActD, partial [Sphingobacteriaceae bacterium]
ANHLFPGRAPRVMDLRATDDRFIIAIDPKANPYPDKINDLLKDAGAVEILHNERKYVSYE